MYSNIEDFKLSPKLFLGMIVGKRFISIPKLWSDRIQKVGFYLLNIP